MAEKKTPDTLTTKQVAEALGTTAKELRVYLRTASKGVGSGKRYAFTAKDVPALKTGFDKWTKERAEAKAAKEAAQAEPAAASDAEEIAEAEETPAPKRTTRTRKTAA